MRKDAAYPREGTVTAYNIVTSAEGGKMQLIPARGRLRLRVSPPKRVNMMQLIPARGRLPQDAPEYVTREELDAAYPREGTVTLYQYVNSNVPPRCSLSPRGDGYSFPHRAHLSVLPMQLIPARGRLLRDTLLFNSHNDAA